MDYTRLGTSGLYVSELALGTIPFGFGGGFEKITGSCRWLCHTNPRRGQLRIGHVSARDSGRDREFRT